MIIIGIDPGQSGGLAFIDSPADPTVSRSVTVHKMPETERDLLDLLEKFDGQQVKAYLEKVHSSPGMGVSAAFTFGRGYGMLRMALVAREIPFDEVTPQKWQGAIGGLAHAKTQVVVKPGKKPGFAKKRDKNVSKRRAQELFPHVKNITHAHADALLIAEYGRRIERGIGIERAES